MDLIERVNNDYDTGRITAHDAACQVLANIDPTGGMSQLDGLRIALRSAIAKYTEEYHEGQRSTAIRVPTRVQVEFAKVWLTQSSLGNNASQKK